VQPYQWQGVGFGGRDSGGVIAQTEGEVLLAVDQPVEAEDSGVREVSVSEPKGQRHLGADARNR